MSTEKMIAMFFSILILGQAWLISRRVGTWIFPSSILGLFWFVYTFIPLALIFSVPVEPMAIAFILVCCTAFSLPALMFNWRDLYLIQKHSNTHARYDTAYLRLSFYGFTVIAIICMALNWMLQGFTFKEIIFDFFQTATKYITARARGEISKNMISQLGLVLTYPAAALGGIVYSARPKTDAGYRIFAIAMLPSTLSMLIEGNKGTLFLAMALFFGGIMVFKINNSSSKIFKDISYSKLSLLFLILLGMVSFAFRTRIGDAGLTAEQEVEKIIWYFRSYSSGHLYAFSDWYSWLLGKSSVSVFSDKFNGGGFYTFMGLFRLLGDDRVIVPGVYAEYYSYDNILQSNIYTIFRGLVIDFGIFGTILFWLALGGFSCILFRLLLVGKSSALPAAFFIYLVGFFYTSFIISLLIWNSIFVSFFITFAVLWSNEWLCRREGSSQRKNEGGHVL